MQNRALASILGLVTCSILLFSTPPTSAEPRPAEAKPSEDEDVNVVYVFGSAPRRYETNTAVSATGIDAHVKDIPRSIQIITEQIILDQQAQDLRDAMQNVSGVQTRNISGGTTDAFILRGIEVGNVYQNGFRIDRNSQRVQTAKPRTNIGRQRCD